MRVCPSCGHENAEDVDFCESCGQYVRWEPTRLAQAVPRPEPAPTPPPAEPSPPPAEQVAPPAPPPAAAPTPPAAVPHPAVPQPAVPAAAASPSAAAPPAPPPPAPPAAPVPQPAAHQQPAPEAAPPPAAAEAQKEEGFFGRLKRKREPAPAAPAAPVAPAAPAAPVAPAPQSRPSAAGAMGSAQQGAGAAQQAAYAPQSVEANVRSPIQAAQAADNPAAALAALGQAAAAPGAIKSAVKAPARSLGGILGKLKRPKSPVPLPAVGGTTTPAADPAAAAVPPIAEPPPTYKSPVPADYKTWMWPAAEIEKKSKAPKIIFLLLLLLVLAAAAGAAWYFLVREDEQASTPAQPAATPLAAFVGNIDGLLRISARDRTKIKRAIVGVERNCRVPPDQAAGDVSEVTQSRRAVLRRVRALEPPNAASKRVVELFQRSLTLSISANAGYSRWLADLQRSPAACRTPAANPSYQAAQGVNARTQTAKRAFVDAYNPLASRFGKRAWTSLQI